MSEVGIVAAAKTGVCVIVVTYEGAAVIGDCLQRLEQSQHQVRIIVVDNASADNTLGVVAQYPQGSD